MEEVANRFLISILLMFQMIINDLFIFFKATIFETGCQLIIQTAQIILGYKIMGNICGQVFYLCKCPQCCESCCHQTSDNQNVKIEKVLPPIKKQEIVKIKEAPIVHHDAEQHQFTEVITQDYGDGPHPSIAKFSKFPDLTPEQTRVWQTERPLKPQQNLKGTPLSCFFLTKKRIWYEGQWKQGFPNGKGRAMLWSGLYYQGYFNKGFAQSSDGLAIFPDGTFYRGNVENSRLNGKGKYYNVTQKLNYFGDWKNDKPQGQGTEIFGNTDRYQGQFRDGYKDGKGRYTWKNGMTYEGDFKLGYMWGFGKLQKGKGLYEGQFYRGKKVSRSATMNTSTGTYKGPFQDDFMQGNGQFHWYDRKIYRGGFDKGELSGKGMIQYPGGQVVQGVWKEGQNQYMDRIRSL